MPHRCSSYEVSRQYRTDEREITSVATTNEGYALALSDGDASSGTGETRLVVLDRELTETATTVFSKWATVGATDDLVCAAFSDGFSTFDTALTQRGHVSLDEKYAGKHMENVLIHDEVAHIVDDLINPLYLFAVDLSDPEYPSYRELVRIDGAGRTLKQQWIDPDADGWYCLRETRSQSSQHVVITPLSNPRHDPNDSGQAPVRDNYSSESIYSEHRLEEDKERTESGQKLLDVAARPPTYATTSADGGTYLSALDIEGTTVSVEEPTVSFDRTVALDGQSRVDSSDSSVVTLSDDGTLLVYDLDREGIGLEQSLDISEPLELWVLDA